MCCGVVWEVLVLVLMVQNDHLKNYFLYMGWISFWNIFPLAVWRHFFTSCMLKRWSLENTLHTLWFLVVHIIMGYKAKLCMASVCLHVMLCSWLLAICYMYATEYVLICLFICSVCALICKFTRAVDVLWCCQASVCLGANIQNDIQYILL